MHEVWSITVTNNTSSPQRYAIIREAPKVTPGSHRFSPPQVFSNVFATGDAQPGGKYTFHFTANFHAFVGSSSGTLDGSQVSVRVNESKRVDLGTESGDWQGSTVFVEAKDGAPAFSPEPYMAMGEQQAFAMHTAKGGAENAFTSDQAHSNNWVVGFGGSYDNMGEWGGPLASWVPEPGRQYQIQPFNRWFVVFGNFSKGMIVDAATYQRFNAKVDFTRSFTPNMAVVHDAANQLQVDKRFGF